MLFISSLHFVGHSTPRIPFLKNLYSLIKNGKISWSKTQCKNGDDQDNRHKTNIEITASKQQEYQKTTVYLASYFKGDCLSVSLILSFVVCLYFGCLYLLEGLPIWWMIWIPCFKETRVVRFLTLQTDVRGFLNFNLSWIKEISFCFIVSRFLIWCCQVNVMNSRRSSTHNRHKYRRKRKKDAEQGMREVCMFNYYF